MGSRTPDLLIANETLYQLSYDPIQFRSDLFIMAWFWPEANQF